MAAVEQSAGILDGSGAAVAQSANALDGSGAAGSAPTLDVSAIAPLGTLDPVCPDTLAVAVREGEDEVAPATATGRVATKDAVHMGAEVRVGSVVVLPSSAATGQGQPELSFVQALASVESGCPWEKTTTRTSTSPELGSPMLGPPDRGPSAAAVSATLAPALQAATQVGRAQSAMPRTAEDELLGQA
jgi:hypothetical protein